MTRVILSIFIFATLLPLAGCCASGGTTVTHDPGFRQQNEAFDRQRAEHMKQSSDAVGGYLRHRNQ